MFVLAVTSALLPVVVATASFGAPAFVPVLLASSRSRNRDWVDTSVTLRRASSQQHFQQQQQQNYQRDSHRNGRLRTTARRYTTVNDTEVVAYYTPFNDNTMSTTTTNKHASTTTATDTTTAASVQTTEQAFSAPSSMYDKTLDLNLYRHRPLPVDDPALVEFVPTDQYLEESQQATILPEELAQLEQNAGSSTSFYPFAAMMQGSAPYIAAHAGQVAVFHIPGDVILEDDERIDNLLSDLALSWLLGIKFVIVVGCKYDTESCSVDFNNSHECQNSLRVTDKDTLRRVEEEAGYLRTEIERKLNRLLRLHGAAPNSGAASAIVEGNVMSGNFYTAQRFGVVRGEDFQNTGFVASVHAENIRKVLDNDDVVLLTTVGLSRTGDLVNVNGYHLAAAVAASLQASKLIFLANEGSVLQKKNEHTPIQEIPLSFSKALTDYHKVQVHNTGFATFERARQRLESRATELLIHLGWASWALERGVKRAHIVNPSDGALLEELFTSKNGVNTCVYHDDEDAEPEDAITQEDWDEFFAAAASQAD